MPFPTDPYWTPHTINRNALAEDAGGLSSGFWTAGGGRSAAVSGNWEIEEGSYLYSTSSRLAHPWLGPKTYNIGYDVTSVTSNANFLNFCIISDIATGTPLTSMASANAYFRLKLLRNGRHDLYYQTANGTEALVLSSGAAVAGAVRTRITISPDMYEVGEKQFAQHILIEALSSVGAVLWTNTYTFPGAENFEDDWQTWRDNSFNYLDQMQQRAHIFLSVADSGGTEYWKLTHLSILNELDSGVHDYVFDPIPDGPVFENPNFNTTEQPYMEWGYLDPAGAPFNCTTDGLGNAAQWTINATQLERCVNWARDFSMGVLLSDGYDIKINRPIELWQWCYQRTAKQADRDYLVDEFRGPAIHGRYTTTKPRVTMANSLYTSTETVLFEINATAYDATPPGPTFPSNWPDSQRIIVTRGTWANTTAYVIGDKVTDTSVDYVCTYPHTSVSANDRPGVGTNYLRFWEVYNPADSGYPTEGRPNATYNFQFYNWVLNMGTGNSQLIGIKFRGAQGTEAIRMDVVGSGFLSGFGDLPGSGGAITSCTCTGGVHAIQSTGSQPGSTVSGFHAANQTGVPFLFTSGANRGLHAFVGCKFTGMANGIAISNNGSDSGTANAHDFGLIVIRDCSFSWTNVSASNKCVDSDRGFVMKNVYAEKAANFGTANNTGLATTTFNQTLASGNTTGWSHLEEAVFPANPPTQTGGSLATLRSSQAANAAVGGGTVVQTPSPLQYVWNIYDNEVSAVTLRSYVGASVAPPADLYTHHYIGDEKWLTIDDVTIDAVTTYGANRGGFTDAITDLNEANTAASTGDVIGLKSGMYLINDSWSIDSGVNVFTPLKQRGFLRPAIDPAAAAPFGSSDTERRPLLRTSAGLNTCIVANMGFFFTPNTPSGFALSFECNTICYSSHLVRRSGEGYGNLPGYPATENHDEPHVQFYGPTGTGQLYTGNEGNAYNIAEGYSHFSVIDTATAIGNGLVEFYSLDAEHTEAWPGNIYLSNFDRVKIYSYKGEANLPILVASDGKVLEAWGPSGNGTPFIHDDIVTTGWEPVSDDDNDCGYVPKPAGVFPAGVKAAGVTLSNVVSYMVGGMQDSGRYDGNNPPVFGWGTRPDGTKMFNIVSAIDGTGSETFVSALYQRPLFCVDGGYDKPVLTSPTAASLTATGVTPTVTTDKASGVLYMVVVPDGDSPSTAQIKAGQQSNGSAAIANSTLTTVSAGTSAFTPVTGLSLTTSYELFFVHTDAAGANSVRRSTGFTTISSDVIAPILTSPTAVVIGNQQATPRVTTDEGNGTLYMVLVPDGDVPSVIQIKLGRQSNGNSALNYENIPVTSTGLKTFTACTGLSESTAYELYFVHTDAAGNDSLAATTGFSTLTTAPVLTLPVAVNPGANAVTPRVTTSDGDGTLYVVVVPDGDAPSVAQIKLGQQSNGSAAIASATRAVTYVGLHTFDRITTLTEGTAYELYFAHTDAVGNNSLSATVGFSTLEVAPILSSPSAILIDENSVEPRVTTNEASGTLYMVVVPDGNVPSVAQIKLGQQQSGAAAISSANLPVTVTGEQIFSIVSSLSSATQYELFFAQTDASANDSASVTVGFLTLSAPGGGGGGGAGGPNLWFWTL